MKKVIFSLAILSLVFATSCGNDDENDEVSCVELAADFDTTLGAFLNAPDDIQACSEYKAATQAYIDANCLPANEAATLQASLDSIDCADLTDEEEEPNP